jgi:hypothetical protein
MCERFVTIATFHSHIEAQLVKDRLADDGIRAGLIGDTSLSAFGLMGAVVGTMDLQVPESERDRALQLLDVYEAERDTVDEPHPGLRVRGSKPSETIRPPEFPRVEIQGSLQVEPPAAPTPESEPIEQCPACNSAVDPGRETCHWCGASLDEARRQKEEEELARFREEHGKNSPIVDDDVLQELATSVGDAQADRAFKLAILGLMLVCIPVLPLISFGLVMAIFVQGLELSPPGKTKMLVALAIDTVVIAALAVVLAQASGLYRLWRY